MVVMAVAFAIYGFFRFRLRQGVQMVTLRNKIAGDLHDDIGSTLSSISLFSTIIQQKLNGNGGEIKGLLEQINQNTIGMMEAMSDIVWTINSKNDSFLNVVNRMRAFANEIMEPLDCKVHFTPVNDAQHIKLTMVQRKNIYLLFKEAINNAAKYSGCRNVWVEIVNDRNKKLVMKIKDDGKGFGQEEELAGIAKKSNSFGGNGIPNMKKRCAEIKGHLDIESDVEHGTAITLAFRF
jgi:signal transduction histidine kinase